MTCGKCEIKRSEARSAALEVYPCHADGCYIRFGGEDEEGERTLAVVDYDADGKVIGVEFPYGLDDLPEERLKRPIIKTGD